MVTIDTRPDGCRIVLEPNRSASWRTNKLLICLLAGWSGAVALFFLALGLWPVLPFLGLEVAAVAAGLYAVCWKLQQRQVLSLRGELLLLEKGHYQPCLSWQLPRQRASLSVELPHHPWDPLRIFICGAGEQVPIGDFLNKEESRQLLQMLKEQGLRVRNYSEVMRLDL